VLKSVGDITQIVALLIGGVITLNIPNSTLREWFNALFKLICASPTHRFDMRQHHLRRFGRMHGVPPSPARLGQTCIILARELSVSRIRTCFI
jgi:hypothetical protein